MNLIVNEPEARNRTIPKTNNFRLDPALLTGLRKFEARGPYARPLRVIINPLPSPDRVMFGTSHLYVFHSPTEAPSSPVKLSDITFESAQDEIAQNSGFGVDDDEEDRGAFGKNLWSLWRHLDRVPDWRPGANSIKRFTRRIRESILGDPGADRGANWEGRREGKQLFSSLPLFSSPPSPSAVVYPPASVSPPPHDQPLDLQG